MRSSWRVPSGDVPTKRRNRLVPVILVAVVGLGAGIYVAARHAPQILGETGCTAGVAHQRRMPSRAVTVAYAAAMQETHLHNLDYGDRDSVGIFQQRPSEGWGPASKLVSPVYASTKFFQALARV